MTRTRRPKAEKPLVPLSAKVSSEVKEAVEGIAENEDRSLSQTLERLLTSHPDVKKKLSEMPAAA